MTFGEHLEELRRSLARAIIWLVIGAVIALLFFAKPVVREIQGPLQEAIVKYYADRSLSQLGYDLEQDKATIEPLRNWMLQHGMAWELVYVLPPEMLERRAPADRAPAEEAAAEEAAADPAADEAPADEVPADETTSGDVEAPASGDATPAGSTRPVAAEPGTAPGAVPLERNLDATDEPVPMNELLSQVPEPAQFQPQLQLKRTQAGLNSHQVEEPFMIYIKAALVVGAIISSPMIFYYLWGFVAAGLYPHERKYVYMYLPFSVGLFISGVALAFFAVLRYVLEFLLDFNSALNVDLEPRLSYYISFVLLLPLGFGIAFQLPLVMLFLQRIGLIETSAYEKSWRIAVLVIAVLSMVLTPADPYSMILLMVPLVALYFLGIGLCRFMPRGRGLGSAAYDPR